MTRVPGLTAALPSGGAIPLLGFGTWQLKGDTAREATEVALEAGYRHLDTAKVYGNEGQVGAALAGAQAFVTTKCPPDEADPRQVLETSLELLGLDAVDLWLVHWPPNGSPVPLWEAFVQAQADGLAKDVGVSNFSLAQLDEVHEATGVMPALNQCRWSPKLYDEAFLEGHRQRGVVFEGYSGLKGGTLDDPVVTGIADRLGATPAQVIVRWHLDQGTVVIPKSANPDRIRSNADVADLQLTPEDRAALDALGD
jgi:2,5-diketo-D-gluconate reductase A